MEFITKFNPPGDEIDFLDQKLLEYNCSRMDNYSYTRFIIKVQNDSNPIIAGIHGQLGGDWVYIQSLWVDERHRMTGLGKRLLFLAEQIAVQKRCLGLYLYTYSFQSSEFYKKRGYSNFGVLENFCGSHSKIFMKKNLV